MVSATLSDLRTETMKNSIDDGEDDKDDGSRRDCSVMGNTGTNCIKICLLGKLILSKGKVFWKSNSLENSL